MQQFFDDLKECMLENADDLEFEEMEDADDSDKKYLLLLLLLGKFNFEEKLKPIFTNMLTTYSTQSFMQAAQEIKQLGEFNITADQRNAIIESIVDDRLAFLLPEIERVTKKMLSANIAMASDKDKLKKAINEAYAVSVERVATIENVEYRTIENITRVEAGKVSDTVGGVLVSDGTDHDSFCFEANGQVWSLDFAGANILQHPNCVRQFTFMSVEEVKDYGGVDVE